MPILSWIGKEAVINHHLDVPFKTLEKKYTFGGNISENLSPCLANPLNFYYCRFK